MLYNFNKTYAFMRFSVFFEVFFKISFFGNGLKSGKSSNWAEIILYGLVLRLLQTLVDREETYLP